MKTPHRLRNVPFYAPVDTPESNIERWGDGPIASGDIVFTARDTFGYPVEMARITLNNDCHCGGFDRSRFEFLLEKQRIKSRNNSNIPNTVF